MDFWAIFWTIAATVIAAVVAEILLNRPKIVVPASEGWIESKQINTFAVKEYSTASSSYTEEELKTRDYYNVYGIQIRNDKFIFSGVNATITNATIKLWRSNGSPLTDWYGARLWGGRKNASNDPLFPREKINTWKVLGCDEDLDIVLAYNQENESAFYKFTIETHLQNNFMIYKDLFTGPMPFMGL